MLADRLMLLLEVIELGSFVKVSKHRNVDRSVISKQIARLEDELDVRLLNRTTRSLSLTAAGTEIFKQAQRLREQLNDTHRIAQNYHCEPKGKLKITSPISFGRQYVQKVVLMFQRKYPEIEFELKLEDRIVDIIGEGFDLALRIGEPKDSSLIARHIARNRMVVVASPDFIQRHGEPKTIADLEKLPAVVYSSTGLVADKIPYRTPSGEEANIELTAAYKVNEGDIIVDTAISGNMLTIVAAHMINDEVSQGKLVPILTDIDLADFGAFYAMYPHRDPPIKTKLFIDALKEIIGKDTPVWEERIPGFENMYGYGRKTV